MKRQRDVSCECETCKFMKMLFVGFFAASAILYMVMYLWLRVLPKLLETLA